MHKFKGKGWSMLAVSAMMMLALAAGCANLGAIRNFADQSSDIAGYTKLVNYYVDAPEEIAPYLSAKRQAEIAATLKKTQSLKEALLARHKIIQAYMESLGRLADNQTVVQDTEFANLGKALENNKFFSKADANAFTKLGQLIAKALTDYWRQNKIKTLIRNANEPIRTLIVSMKSVVDKDYVGSLNVEERAITRYYDEILLNSNDLAGIEALKEVKKARLNIIKKRREEVNIYSEALGNIAAGHQELFDNLNKPIDSKELLDQMIVYARYLRDAKNALESM